MASSAQIAKQLEAYDRGRKSSATILKEAMAQYGIPEMRQRVAGLRTTLVNTENALDAVDPSVTGRTSRSLVTEAQRSRIVNQEREPIAAQYRDQERALSNESSNLTTQESAANKYAEGRINDYTVGRQALQSRYDAAVAAEKEARRRLEADREFQRKKEEAERSRQSSAQSGGGSSKSSKPTLESLFSGYTPHADKYYTESVVIPKLMSTYGYSKKKAADMAYSYRKLAFGE